MKSKTLATKFFFIFLFGWALSACSVNPVTGKQEMSWLGENWEIQTGERYYGFQKQAGGGHYHTDPQLSAYVSSVGNRIKPFSSRPHLPYEFVVLNDSSANAWALPGGKIAINRGLLLELNNEAELAAVIAHEIVHADARHSAQSQELGSLIQLGQVAASTILSNAGYGSGIAQQGIAYGALYGHTSYSRSRELEADKYGMQYMRKAGYDPKAAVTLQETFVRLSAGRRSDFFSELFASHPPSPARVQANKITAGYLPPGGSLGVDTYKRATRLLHQRKPAYEKGDESAKLIHQKKYEQAVKAAEDAIKLEPKESRFYEAKGFALFKIGDKRKALKSYEKAAALDSTYFRILLGKGMTEKELGRHEQARISLEKSAELAPTATAYVALGEIAAIDNNCTEASRQFEKATKAGARVEEINKVIGTTKTLCFR